MSANGDPRLNLLGLPKVTEQPRARLESWKEIASYLMRSERTVRRWEETEELPVHRQLHEKRGSVYAYVDEVDAWRQSRRLPEPEHSDLPRQQSTDLPNGSMHGDAPKRGFVEFNELSSKTVRLHPRLTASLLWMFPRRGYHGPADPPANVDVRTRSRVSTWVVVVVAGFVFLIGAVLLHYWGWQARRTPSPESASLVRAGTGDGNQSAGFGSPLPPAVPLTTDPGDEIQPSFSPDGNQVAYAFNEGDAGHYHLWVKAIGSEQAVRLTSASYDDMSPAWSPDGESIAFIRLSSGSEASVMIIPSSGGNEGKLASIAVNLLHTDTTRVSWSPDGNWIATTDVNFSAMFRLILISVKTGLKQNLNYEPSKFDTDSEPSFSPNGRYLAFTRYISPVVADIFVLELPHEEGGRVEARQLTHWNRWSGNPIWSADGQEILFIRKEAGIGSRIWRVAAFHNTDARLVESVGEGSRSFAFSATSHRLVYSSGASDLNIWRISLDSTSSSPTPNHSAAPIRLIASTRGDG